MATTITKHDDNPQRKVHRHPRLAVALYYLQQNEHSCCGHVFTSSDGLEANKRHLHREDGAQTVEACVGHVEARGVASCEAEHEDMERYEVNDEDVAAPGRDHVKVGECTEHRPGNAAGAYRSQPQEVGKEQSEDRNTLVVVAASHRPTDVTGN